MATQILKWLTIDGQQFDAQEDADNHELISAVSEMLFDTATQHDITCTREAVVQVAEVLVMSDAFARLKGLLRNKL